MCVCLCIVSQFQDVWSVLSPTWQVYIDDPDVANAAKENISVSFYASVGGIFFVLNLALAGGCKYVYFHPYLGKMNPF